LKFSCFSIIQRKSETEKNVLGIRSISKTFISFSKLC
jgi:hypothetical protein